MSRFKAEGRRYHQNIGSSYMGAGRTEASLTHRAKPAFAKLRQIYGDHLEKTEAHYPSVTKGQQITPEVRLAIRQRIKKEQRLIVKKQIMVGTLVTCIIVALFLWLWDSENILQMLQN